MEGLCGNFTPSGMLMGLVTDSQDLWSGGISRWTNSSFVRLGSMRSMYNQVSSVRWSYQDVGVSDYNKGKHFSADMEETLEGFGEIETQSG